MAHPVDPRRREALKRAGALAASTLSGCACPMSSWRMGDPPALRPGPLAPPPPKKGSLDLPLVIDAHCHIFNVEDVPASAMLKGPVAHDFEQDKNLQALIRGLADIISAIAYFVAPSARDELWMLEELSEQYEAMRSSDAAIRAIDERLTRQTDRFSRYFSRVADYPDFVQPYRKQREAYLKATGSKILTLDVAAELSEEGIRETLTTPELLLAKSPRGAVNPKRLIYFAFTLTAPRYLNLAILQRTYCGGRGLPAVDVFCPSQLDLNHWLGCRETATTQNDQVLLLEQIAIMSEGTMLPFVAYNPRTDVIDENASFDRVVDAITKRGFIGVKLYPPMGFRPLGNSGRTSSETCPALPDGDAIDKRLEHLYGWCADNNVPVMAHTSHSFGATDAQDECAAPSGWKRALECFKGLRVQAGHFGGDSAYALGPEGWAAQYTAMMDLPEAVNLYVDVSNLGELFVPGSPVHNAIDPLVRKRIAGSSKEIVANRMTYGSDWYMTLLSDVPGAVLSETNTYFEQIEKDTDIPGLRNGALGLNAARLYGLCPARIGGKETNWDRLTRYYKDHGIEKPNWMDKAEKAHSSERS